MGYGNGRSEMSERTATLGAGCFWGVEWVYRQVPGVKEVVSGFSGGHVPDVSYREVCNGTTGHAEVVQITFDPEVVTFEQLLEVFWAMHDPTQVDRQGPDVGTQYRSAIYTHSPEQQTAAEASRDRAQTRFARPIATEIAPFEAFYPAEAYHQRYYESTGHEPYCHVLPVGVLRDLGLVPAAS
jgi:peptide-methionine (S)-S-oxide reductase